MLRCINGLEIPEEGTVFINEQPLNAKNPQAFKELRSKMGFVFQHFNLFPHKTVLENLTLAPIQVLGMEQEAANQKALELLKRVGLSDKKDVYPNKLSGGQKQRVACARAIVTEPSLILADEPTGALDSKSASMLLDNFEYLNEQKGATIVMVTHDAFTASHCSRILFIQDGLIFHQLHRGNSDRKAFFQKIMKVVSDLGGDSDHVL